MSDQNILVESKNRIAYVTINRPDKLNALNAVTKVELREAFEAIADNPEISVVILTGIGEKSFVAGTDIKELADLDAKTGKVLAEGGQAVFSLIENLGKPVIAAVNGFALGGGCELALACHVRIASENAKFGQPEVNLGIIPGYGGTQRLTRLVGKAKATEMILTGDFIDAQEAYRIGLVNRVVPLPELIKTAEEMAQKISSKSQVAIRLSLTAINAADEVSLSEGLEREATLFGKSCETADAKEGIAAFLEKRKPNFTNK
ncbi:MAG: enoyl-CoA hydratase [Ignavibacteria bacterium]|nr:enoyl-CoA hydratase [Ignavibacteria bacterium]